MSWLSALPWPECSGGAFLCSFISHASCQTRLTIPRNTSRREIIRRLSRRALMSVEALAATFRAQLHRAYITERTSCSEHHKFDHSARSSALITTCASIRDEYHVSGIGLISQMESRAVLFLKRSRLLSPHSVSIYTHEPKARGLQPRRIKT